MTTQEIADRLVELCRKGEWEAAQKELFSNNAVSIEPHSTPDFSNETKGLDAIIEKGKKWAAMVDKVHDLSISEPLVAANSIALILGMDVSMKDGQRMNMKELCVYNVKDGKIVSEEFHM